MQGQAIYCQCYLPEFDRYKILGSITPEGLVEILRGHKNKTILEVHEFFIKCKDCGFSRYIKIESVAVNRSNYEQN